MQGVRCFVLHDENVRTELFLGDLRDRTECDPSRSLDGGHKPMNFPYLTRFQPVLLSLFRFITGLLLFQYGVAKLFKFPAVPMFAKVELMSLYGAAGTLELVLGGLLMIGLFSRLAAFILSGEMAFAYFMGHMFRGES